jgi:hypothetical protein
MNNRIVELLTVLTSSPMPSRGFELPENEFERHQQTKFRALLELARLQNDQDVWQALTRVAHEVSPTGGIILNRLDRDERDRVLQKVGEYARVLLSAFSRAQAKEAKVTNHEKVLREAGTRDPFLDGDVNLTRDSFAGRGEVEPDTWSQGVNLERRR